MGEGIQYIDPAENNIYQISSQCSRLVGNLQSSACSADSQDSLVQEASNLNHSRPPYSRLTSFACSGSYTLLCLRTWAVGVGHIYRRGRVR